MIRGVIFDLDGVILDSMSIWHDLGERYLNVLGMHPEEGLSRTLFSMSMEEGAAYLQNQYSIPKDVPDILNDLHKMLEDFYFYEVQPKAGAKELMIFLKENHVPMVAATSSPREHVTRALERNGLLTYLETIFTTGEVGESKHNPKIYNMASEFLHTEPYETLVFEDSLYALQTAKEAGYRTVGIFDAAGESDQTGMKASSEVYLRDLSEFMEEWNLFNQR